MPRPIDPPPITLALLAGGEGSRMGRPKALLEIRGRPILAYLLERLAWPGPTLLVTAPGREHPPAWELFEREVTDPVAGLGPLRGVLTALEAARTPLVLVTTVDMPDVGAGQLEWLVERIGRHPTAAGVMCSRAQEGVARIEPFPSIFRTSAAAWLGRRLDAGERSVSRLTRSGAVLALPTPDWAPRVWVNLNRPEDVRGFEERA